MGTEEKRKGGKGKVRGGKWFKEMGRGWQGERKEDHIRRGEEDKDKVDKEGRTEAEGKEEDGSDKGVGEICS